MSALTEPWIGRGRSADTGPITSTTTAITTTETAFAAISDLVVQTAAGRRYMILLMVPALSTVAGDIAEIYLRDGNGSAPTAGTSPLVGGGFAGRLQLDTIALTQTFHFDWTPPAGQHDLGVFCKRAQGTGSLTIGSANLLSYLTVYDVGLA